jgi:hypothetical protein
MTARFWGWSENEREFKRDLQELSQRAREGKPLYGTSNQPEWVQQAAAANSTFSQLKFCAHPQVLLPSSTTDFLISSSYFQLPCLCTPSPLLQSFLVSNRLYRFNFVNHNVHGSDPAKYGVQKETPESS